MKKVSEILGKDGELADGELYLEVLELIPAESSAYNLPTYRFHIFRKDDELSIGMISLKVGFNDMIYFVGNIGYEVYPEYRGSHYAYKACLLVIKLARLLGMEELYITCDPENYASARTCELLRAENLGIVKAPAGSQAYKLGIRTKIRYKLGIV